MTQRACFWRSGTRPTPPSSKAISTCAAAIKAAVELDLFTAIGEASGLGDLIVRVEVIVPEKLSSEEAQLVRQLAELRGEAVAPREEGFFSRIKSAFQ